MKPHEEYVRGSEGAKLLGIKRNAFFYLVKSGQIKAEPGRKPRDGRYSMTDILAVKKKRESSEPRKPYKRKNQPVIIVDWSHATDIPAGLKLAQRLYGPDVDIAEVATYASWRKSNDRISMAAFSEDRETCFAALQVLPLDESIIFDILTGQRQESSIRPEEIRSYDEPGAYTLLATNMICSPDHPILLYRLLENYMNFWIEMFPDRYITKLYTQTVSETGERLAQHFFMLVRHDIAYNAYELELARPAASKIIRVFKHRLQQKAPLPPDLQWPPVMTRSIAVPIQDND